LDEIQTKFIRVFLLAIHSHLYSFALRSYFFKLTQPLTVSRVHLLYTVKEKGGKSDRKLYPLPYGLRTPYRLTNLTLYRHDEPYTNKPRKNLIQFVLFESPFTSVSTASRGHTPLCSLCVKVMKNVQKIPKTKQT
jgi:hypothetical protein